jgi:type IV pilus assembly protein PilE
MLRRKKTVQTTHHSLRSSLMRGFTLVELMVVVAIVGILSAIALPSYSEYVLRGKIPDAIANLAAKRVQLEQYYQDNKLYALAAPACVDQPSKYFTFSCTIDSADNQTYTLTATGKESMAAFAFKVNQQNVKMTTAVPSGWALPNPNDCWVTSKGGKC